jgi:hypothetical protein
LAQQTTISPRSPFRRSFLGVIHAGSIAAEHAFVQVRCHGAARFEVLEFTPSMTAPGAEALKEL